MGSSDRRRVGWVSRLFRLIVVAALVTPLAVLATSGTAAARPHTDMTPHSDMSCGVMGDMGQPCCTEACAIIGGCAVLPESPQVLAHIVSEPACVTALPHTRAVGRTDPPDPPPPRARND